MTSQFAKIAAGIGLLCASTFSASAYPASSPVGPAIDTTTSNMIQPVAQGCGPGGWRGPGGMCRYGRYYRPYGYYGYRHYRPYGYYRYHRYGCPPGFWRGPGGYCRR